MKQMQLNRSFIYLSEGIENSPHEKLLILFKRKELVQVTGQRGADDCWC